MKSFRYFRLFEKYLDPKSLMYRYYIPHVVMVTSKALAIAHRLRLTTSKQQFIEECAMLHDIGIIYVKAENIGCHGNNAYITHGIHGANLLRKEGLPRHARAVERHVGVGIGKQEIIRNRLPLPRMDFIPKTLEEKIVCYSDLFFSKKDEFLFRPRAPRLIKGWLKKFGREHIERFETWQRQLGK